MQSWHGKDLRVDVLYSKAGVAQHIWISNEDGDLLVDTGDGVLRDILANKLNPKILNAILYTHGHFDHVGGLYSLLGFLRMIGRKKILQIFAPEGSTEASDIIDVFEKSYAVTLPFKTSYREIRPHEIFEIAGMRIEAYPVVHCGSVEDKGILDPVPAFGYRISCGAETIAITGDTGTNAPLEELVKGVDLAILEAVCEKSQDASQETLRRVHLSEEIARDLGKLAKEYFIIHKGKRRGKRYEE